MLTPDQEKLKEAALAASPGPWKGDRLDGTVKYELLDANGKAVIAGNNGNCDNGPYGIMNDEDERYLMAANPAAILAILAQLEQVQGDADRLDWLERMANEPGGLLLHDGSDFTGRLGLGLRRIGRTLRQAVDAVRANSPLPPPPEAA